MQLLLLLLLTRRLAWHLVQKLQGHVVSVNFCAVTIVSGMMLGHTGYVIQLHFIATLLQ